MKNAGKACNNRLYRHIRTFEKIVKNYFVIYLRNKQSIRKTADAMFVHYRTISYRLEKIKQISGINFDNANEVLAVSNGLIIYKMLKEIE